MTSKNILTQRWLLALLTLTLALTSAKADENANTRQARQIFDKTYNMVFGPQGCSLTYDVNIVGVYKTQGSISMKGKKKHYTEKRYVGWCDGKDVYRVDKKKKTVEIHNPNSPKRDKYASKFKFEPDNYVYHIASKDNDFIITIDAKKGVDGVKHAKAIIDKRTRVPKSLKVKVLFFWANVNISNFHSGISNEHIFNFPASQYRDYDTTDCRPD